MQLKEINVILSYLLSSDIWLQMVGLIVTYFLIAFQFGQSGMQCEAVADVGNCTCSCST